MHFQETSLLQYPGLNIFQAIAIPPNYPDPITWEEGAAQGSFRISLIPPLSQERSFCLLSYIYIKFLLCMSDVCMCVCLYACMSVCHVFFIMTSNPYISAKNQDNDTKPSGYDPLGLRRSSTRSRMTLSSKCPVRNPQCPPSTPLLDPPFLTHFWLGYQHKMFRVSSLG